MEPRECFPLGRGTATIEPSDEAPTPVRPFGMRQAITVAPSISDDTDGIALNPATQILVLIDPTGDPELDAIELGKKSSTQRATDRDAQRPTTPKDMNTDSD